jgi:hypothetical protein
VADDPISDHDRDSLHILPLAIIPLHTKSLRRARLVKNVQLDSVIEFFDDPTTGAGHLSIEALPHEYSWPEVPVHPDLKVLRSLAKLSSFDVYSLRVQLRDFDISVNDYDALRLSPRKAEELTVYMRDFTRPLIQNIYGTDDLEIQCFEQLVSLLRNPDVKQAIQKLTVMAETLNIRIEEIPGFLEDYGDIFLSLSYYKQCLDCIEPTIADFLEWLDEVNTSWQGRSDPQLNATCHLIEDTINGTMAAISGRLESFYRNTRDMWESVSAERFRKVETLIKGYHTTIGGQLCALSVKIQAWARSFPSKNAGGPARRATFLMTEMRQGIERVRVFETGAPSVSALR